MTAVEVLSKHEIVKEFKKSKSGLAGAAILLGLILMTLYSVAAVPLDSFRQWNSPNFWIDLPKSAAPAWTNIGLGEKLPEHIVLNSGDAAMSTSVEGGVRTVTHAYTVNFNYDDYPNDFMLLYSARYGSTQPVLQIDVLRPDGSEFRVYFASLPSSQQGDNEFSGRVFSTSSNEVVTTLRSA